MALPSNLSTRTVTGNYVSPDGVAIAGQIRFTLPDSLIDSSEGKIVVESSKTATLDANGSFSVTIPVTNDADVTPLNYVYTVTELFPGGRTYTISLPTGSAINIATISPTGTFTQYYTLASSPVWNATVARLVVQEGSYNATGYILRPSGYTGSLPITVSTFTAINPVAAANATAAQNSATAANGSLSSALASLAEAESLAGSPFLFLGA